MNRKKTILCASPTKINSKFAHSINFFKTSEGFANNGLKTIIVCRNTNFFFQKKSIFDTLINNKSIEIIKMPSLGFFRRLNDYSDFSKQIEKIVDKIKPDYAYFRSYAGPEITIQKNIKTTVESHSHPNNNSKELKKLLSLYNDKNLKSLITISPVLKNNFIKKKVPKNKIKIISDGYDDKIFYPLPKNNDKKFITYFGHLYEYKGIKILFRAAKILSEYNFKIIGGTNADIKEAKKYLKKKNIKNVLLQGFVHMKDIRNYLKDTSMFILPPSKKHPSAKWTSPLKLCEYLALGMPVIASNIPALKYWIKKKEVIFFKSDDHYSLVKKIRKTIKKENVLKENNNNILKFLKDKTYTARAKKILQTVVKDE